MESAKLNVRTLVATATILTFLVSQAAGAMTAPANPLRLLSAQDDALFALVACQGKHCMPPGGHKPGGNFKPGVPHKPGGPFKPGGHYRPHPGPYIPPHHMRPPSYRPAYRPWRRQAYFGAVIAGVTLGAIIATAANAAPPPPSPDLCWYWNDPSLTSGYWDYCW